MILLVKSDLNNKIKNPRMLRFHGKNECDGYLIHYLFLFAHQTSIHVINIIFRDVGWLIENRRFLVSSKISVI